MEMLCFDMKRINAVKMGAGSGLSMLGVYVMLSFSDDILMAVLGILCMSIGISLVASS